MMTDNTAPPSGASEPPRAYSLDDVAALLGEDAARARDPARDKGGRYARQEALSAVAEAADPLADDAEEGEEDDGAEEDADDAELEEEGEEEGGDEEDPSFDLSGGPVRLSELVHAYEQAQKFAAAAPRIRQTIDEAQGERKAARAERQAYQSLLSQVGDFLVAQAPSEDAIEALMTQDPVEGWRAQRLREEILGKAKEFGAAYQHMAQEAMAETARDMRAEQERLRAAIPDVIPEWRDQATASREISAIRDMMLRHRFSAEELDYITDPRVFPIMRKAALYEQAQERGKAALRAKPAQSQGPRNLSPGGKAAHNAKHAQRRLALKERAKQTGSLADIAALIAQD